MIAKHVAIESARLDPVDAVLGIPVALLVGDDEGPVRVEADPVGGAETGGQDVGLAAIPAHPEEGPVVRDHRGQGMPRRLRVVKVAVVIGLQAHGELVEVFGVYDQ